MARPSPLGHKPGQAFVAVDALTVADPANPMTVKIVDALTVADPANFCHWSVPLITSPRPVVASELRASDLVGRVLEGTSVEAGCCFGKCLGQSLWPSVVHEALWNHNLFEGAPRLGRTCGADPDRNTADTRAMGTDSHGDWFRNPTTSTRGDYHAYYGWLYNYHPQYNISGAVSASWTTGPVSTAGAPPLCGHSATSSSVYECGGIYANVQHFWRR